VIAVAALLGDIAANSQPKSLVHPCGHAAAGIRLYPLRGVQRHTAAGRAHFRGKKTA
jgi:hypothetical protein